MTAVGHRCYKVTMNIYAPEEIGWSRLYDNTISHLMVQRRDRLGVLMLV